MLEGVSIKKRKKQVSNAVSTGEKNYKYYIGYKDDDQKVKPPSIMLPNVMIEKLNGCNFLLKIKEC